MAGGSTYHHGSLHQVLIDVSLDLIAEHGLEGFSLATAAKAAGVSVAAPYRHFTNKAALLGAIARTGYAQLGEALREAADRHPDDPVEALLELGSAYVGFVIDQPALASVMFSVRGRAPESDAGLAALGVLGDVLARLEAAGRLAVPLDTALRATWSLVHGLAVLHTGGMRTISEEDAPLLRKQVLRPLLDGMLRR
ncbi:TetR/AcrR family transcriptional regulator [Pseudonocardia aurantiaca]|uniref:TetR/AcrR family transcriptional regulator n=1 Tax=Pseudonocardia aurantiaca TaxID=75290 RepID=A0ABW4G1F5_9PSEU